MNQDPDLRYLGWEGYETGAIPVTFRAKRGYKIQGACHISDYRAAQRAINEHGRWDVLNINTPYVRDYLHPAGLIRSLDSRFSLDALPEQYGRFAAAAFKHDGQALGVPQRFGPFNIVINGKRLSKATAVDLGFRLPLLSDFKQRYGILAYDDFNVMHIALSADLNPFHSFDMAAVAKFKKAAIAWHLGAAIVTTNHSILNAALVNGEIDFYLSGGTYTASPARLAGRSEIVAVTPRSGPIKGKGGVSFVEVNALLEHGALPISKAEAFLDFIRTPEGSLMGALAAGSCNPVIQMSSSAVFSLFTPSQLDALQWETLLEDLSHCADYALIPDYQTLLDIIFDVRR